MRRFVSLLALAALAVGVMAQPDPAAQQPGGVQPVGRPLPAVRVPLIRQQLIQPAVMQRLQLGNGQGMGFVNLMMNGIGAVNEHDTQLEVTPAGMFVLRAGVLACIDLKLQGQKTLELFGPMPAQPDAVQHDNAAAPFQDAPNPNFPQWLTEQAKRSAPALMLPDGERLLIVIGDTFFNVNTRTVAIDAQGDLADKAVPAPVDAQPQMMILNNPVQTAPIAKVQGDTLYLVREKDVLTVDVKTGKVLGRLALPKQMAPAPPPPLPMQALPPVPPPNPPANAGPAAPFANIGRGATAQVAEATVVGKVLIIADPVKPNTLAAKLTNDQGKAYLVTGDKCKDLLAVKDLEKKRVRVSGRATEDGAGNATLEMTDFQVLEG